jgi:hypothetical protein
MTYGEFFINSIKKIEGKYLKSYELNHGFPLPKYEIVKIDCLPKSYSNKIVFGNIYIHVKLEVKDGRLGRLKKFLKDLISSMINSLGYQFDEIYLDFTV